MSLASRVILLAALTAPAAGCAGSGDRGEVPAAAAGNTALADAPDRTLQRGDVSINYRTLGTGEAVLLVHGYGDNLLMWSGFLADSLARDHRVIAVDTRAFGKSSKPAGVAQYGTAMVDDLIAVLDQEGIQQAHVVGYSMGAVLGANLALAHPDRVRSVTLAAGVFAKDSAAMRAVVAPWIADLTTGRRLTQLIKDIVPVLPDSIARAYSDDLVAQSDSAALVAVLDAFPRLNVDWDRVAASRIPATVIVGVDDPLRPYSAPLAARWPEARLVEVPATDHMTIFSSPTLLSEVRALTRANPSRR